MIHYPLFIGLLPFPYRFHSTSGFANPLVRAHVSPRIPSWLVDAPEAAEVPWTLFESR